MVETAARTQRLNIKAVALVAGAAMVVTALTAMAVLAATVVMLEYKRSDAGLMILDPALAAGVAMAAIALLLTVGTVGTVGMPQHQ